METKSPDDSLAKAVDEAVDDYDFPTDEALVESYNEGIKKVIAEYWEEGLSVYQYDKKGIFELRPDGSKKYIKLY